MEIRLLVIVGLIIDFNSPSPLLIPHVHPHVVLLLPIGHVVAFLPINHKNIALVLLGLASLPCTGKGAHL